MSATPESEFNLELHFLPAWAKESSHTNRFKSYEGETREERRPRGRGPKGPRADRDRDRERGPRPPRGADRPARRDRSEERAPRDGRREERGGGPRHQKGGERPAPVPLPEVNAAIIPERAGVESLARQIKLAGRAYPLFEIAGLVLQKPERFHIEFSVVRKGETVAQPLFLCALDDTLWLNQADAARHAFERHFDKFYQAERKPADPPKGTFTHVAVCGMSGVVLGPPNWHGYQAALARLHAERFSQMPFDVFKSRIKTMKDEAQVKQWVEEQSFATEFVCAGQPDAPRLGNREEAERHFQEQHAPNVVRSVESHRIPGALALGLPCRPLRELARRFAEDQRRFPLKVVNVLSQQFAALGLQFFKKDKTVTYVSVARPHFLDVETTPVSDGVRRIIDFINATPNCSRVKLLEALAPSLAAAHAHPHPPAEGAPAPPAAPAPAPSEAGAAVVADLHWLIHQGHVLEFANGVMETAKRPNPKPQQQALARDAGYVPAFLGNTPLLPGI